MKADRSHSAMLPATTITEAAAWVARLHGPLRTPEVERGLREWLNESDDHVRAMQLVTDSWEEVGELRASADIKVTLRESRPDPRTGAAARGRFNRWIAVGVAATLAMVAVALWLASSAGVSTERGEQRILALEDGSRVYLNTMSHVVVSYSRSLRSVRLEAGEAFFEVARQPGRPFVVSVGDRAVEALGTSFLVRREVDATSVTLVDGQVAITERDTSSPGSAVASDRIVLKPGERLVFGGARSAPTRDAPSLEKLTAWQRGKVPIENASLSAAVAEMNRYSKLQIAVESPEAGDLRVSGIFNVGDSLSFARAVARSYGLSVEERDGRIVIR